MRIRFLTTVAVPGGPLYNPGEAPATDRFILTEARARAYVARGLAELLTSSSSGETRAPDGPPKHKMIERAPVRR